MHGHGSISHSRLRATLVAILLTAAACGQKAGVAEQPGPLVGASGDIGSGQVYIDPETGEAFVQTPDGRIIRVDPVEAATDSAIEGTADNTETATDPETGASSSTATTSTSAPVGGDATGVTDSTIKIGIHAPLTGASPVGTDIVGAQNLYFRWLKSEGRSIFGRDVEVILKDDRDEASHAVSVCKEMVEQHRVFLIVGVAGPDQIRACARYAASEDVPYLSVGSTKAGLDELDNYFALSMAYPDQSPMLAEMLVNRLGARDERNAIVRHNSATSLDTLRSWTREMEVRGAAVHFDKPISKHGTSGDATVAAVAATELKQRRIDNVFAFLPPLDFVQLVRAAAEQEYYPHWVGMGLTVTIEATTDLTCPQLGKADFFSPFPAVVDAERFDREFGRAFERSHGDRESVKDVYWIGWASAKTVAQMLMVPGATLTRERFIYMVERARIETGAMPALQYSPTDRFGGRSMHLLRAQCDDAHSRWKTVRAFVPRI